MNLGIDCNEGRGRETHKKFDAFRSVNMLLKAQCMSDTVILSSENKYFRDFPNQHPVNY